MFDHNMSERGYAHVRGAEQKPFCEWIEAPTVEIRLTGMRTILSVAILITGLLAPTGADGPVSSLFTSQSERCVERPAKPHDEPARVLASASPGARAPE